MVEAEFYPPKDSLKEHIQNYWKKIFETPNEQNLATDPDGSRHDVTTNPVYLASSTIGPVTRKLPDISGDKSFFAAVNPVGICDRELDPGESENDLKKYAKDDEDTATSVSLTIDDKKYDLKDIKHRTGHVGPFDIMIPDKSLSGLEPPGQSKAVADGYYVIINPLSPGPHTIRFQAGVDKPHKESQPWEQDVTYTFKVK
jgi:hypothetical protein